MYSRTCGVLRPGSMKPPVPQWYKDPIPSSVRGNRSSDRYHPGVTRGVPHDMLLRVLVSFLVINLARVLRERF